MNKVTPNVSEKVNKTHSSNVPCVQAIQTCKPPTISPAEVLNEIKAFLKIKYKIAQERKAMSLFRFYKILTRDGHSSGDAVASEMKVSRQTVVNYARDLKDMGLIIAERGYYGKYLPIYPIDFFNKKYCKKIEIPKPPTPPSNDYKYNNISSRDSFDFISNSFKKEKKKIPTFFAVIINNSEKGFQVFHNAVKKKYGDVPETVVISSPVERSKVIITTDDFIRYTARKNNTDENSVKMIIRRLIYWICNNSMIKYDKMTNITGLCYNFIKKTKTEILSTKEIIYMVDGERTKNRNRKIETVSDIIARMLGVTFFSEDGRSERSPVSLTRHPAHSLNL